MTGLMTSTLTSCWGRAMLDPVTKVVLSVRPRGGKLKHWREALPDCPTDFVEAVHRRAREIADKRAERWRRRQGTGDPLISARTSRPYRTPSALAKRREKEEARHMAAQAALERDRQREERAAAVRKSLISAAAVARKMGFSVRKSESLRGLVSSYYATPPGGGRPIRISDHEIPWTPARDARAADHGGFNGYPGTELILDEPRRAEWVRRWLFLALDGRR